jgi:ADP-ribosylglycohydrolase
VRTLAARTGAATDTDLTAAAYLGLLFERMFEYEFSYPAAAASHQVLPRKEGPAWEEIKALASQSLMGLSSTGLPGLKDPKTIGDGTTTLSVLGRALAAVSGFENYPERALQRAVEGSGGSTLVGALAGAMIGARAGIPGLPLKWLTRLESRYALEELATDAVYRFEADPAHSPVPKEREAWFRRYPPVKNPVSAEKWRGSLLAGAVGDALGAPIEFLSTAAILERYGPNGVTDYVNHSAGAGSITDDTQMTLFTAEALIRAHAQRRRNGQADVRHALQLAYQRWLHTQNVPWERARGPRATTQEPDGWLITNRGLFHRRAPGSTCFASLENYGRTGDIGSFTHQLNDSKGCGGVMRAAPAALWSDDPGEVFELGAVSAALTHSHPSGYLSAGTLAVIVQQLLTGAALDAAIAAARAQLVRWPGHEEQATVLDAAVALAAQGNPTAAKVESLGSGFVGESALAIAVYAALITQDPNTALLVAVNHSGDSDSTGAVCGNIVGAHYGERAINPGWLARLELREVIEQVAADTLAEFGPNPPTGHDWYVRYPSDLPESREQRPQ